jgi:uncharacterized paraquat-inducible protein A
VTVVEIKKYSYPEGPTYYLCHGGKVQIFQNYPTMEQRLQQVFSEQQQPNNNTTTATSSSEKKGKAAKNAKRLKPAHWLCTPNSRVTVDRIECTNCHILNNKMRSRCRRCHTQL